MTDTFTIGTPNFVTDLSLSPQCRIILSHLKAGKNITQMKAMGVYHVSRLSHVVNKLRQAGYDIVTEMCEDEVGGKYASYTLATEKR